MISLPNAAADLDRRSAVFFFAGKAPVTVLP
jgi:hypothetical protein